ncbi:MAG TPA: cytochrome c [Rhodopila sp.]|nr:cytochrome c [Rhodopila sp.]
MRHVSRQNFQPAQVFGPAFLLLTALLLPQTSRAADTAGDDHQQAVAALTDVKAAIAEIVQADSSYATNKDIYYQASQRAINALAGAHGAGYAADAGTPGDAEGAIGHIDALLNRQGTPAWATALHGAEANVRAAIVHLNDATHAHELMDYAIAVSRALTYLQVAQGRPTEIGLFGGLEGALANTVLGVPAGAQQQDACAGLSSTAPAYGTHGGYLAWVTIPAGDGKHVLAEDPGATDVSVQNGAITLHTAANKLVMSACDKHAEAAPAAPAHDAAAQAAPASQAARAPQTAQTELAAAKTPADPAPSAQAATSAQAAPSTPPAQQDAPKSASGSASGSAQTKPAASDGDPLPALYTEAQAKAGSKIFAAHCVACHGANLQGTAAPSVAGTDFLTTAQHNGWTLQIIRYIVFKMMPRNAPATLSPEESADVMAFLLASDCYPAGSKPFPSDEEPSFAKVHLGPVPNHPAGQNGKGVCPVH